MIRQFLLVGFLSLSVCGSAAAQFATMPGAANAPAPSDYLLGPYDRITVKVFGEDKMSAEKIQIDASGDVILPMIGDVVAGGKTPAQLSNEISDKLEKYLQSPHVSVVLDEAVSQRITVSGAVTEPGIFTLKGRTTLNQAVALAKGADTKVADLHHVAIFRQIDGRNARAVFDLHAIQMGTAQDPEVLGGDSIIVEGSSGKAFWRELVSALPALAVFAYF